ncbi:MAG TPA: AbgT family transporter [Ktedonobacterales bacterium]|jgi:aminobenzoyl-glutamate transport protein
MGSAAAGASGAAGAGGVVSSVASDADYLILIPLAATAFLCLRRNPLAGLAAYRIGDSPVNMLTPLMVYFPFIVTVAQRYRKDAGVGTVISMMLPYALIMLVAWTIVFVLWFALGIPLGPGYPVRG